MLWDAQNQALWEVSRADSADWKEESTLDEARKVYSDEDVQASEQSP